MALWDRQGKAGRFFNASLSRTYETKDDGIACSPNVGRAEIGDALFALVAAATWMDMQRKPRGHSGGDYSGEATEAEFNQDADGGDPEFY